MLKPLAILKITVIAFTIFITVELTDTAFAQNENRIQARACDRVTANVQNRLTKFKENRKTHEDLYTKLEEKLASIEIQLEANGQDTTELKQNIDTLALKIDTFSTDHAKLVQKLEQAKIYACGESEDAFIDILQQAIEQLAVLKQDVRDIKTYYRTVVRANIIDLKNQNPN